MKIATVTRLEQNARRVGEIMGVFAKFGLADWFKGIQLSWIQERLESFDGQRIPDLKMEERVRLAFIELGPTFIKLGQILSTWPDLVGTEMALCSRLTLAGAYCERSRNQEIWTQGNTERSDSVSPM